MEAQPQLVNTIPAGGGGDYELAPSGVSLFGLVLIKNCEVTQRDPNKKEPDKKVPGFRLCFRSYDNPKAWLNIQFKASANEKSKMFMVLRAMSGKKIKKGASPDVLFAEMIGMRGNWYEINVAHNKVGERTYANLVDDEIEQHEGPKGAPDSVDYFTELDSKG